MRIIAQLISVNLVALQCYQQRLKRNQDKYDAYQIQCL